MKSYQYFLYVLQLLLESGGELGNLAVREQSMNPSPEHRTVEDILSLPSILGCIKFTLTSLYCCGPCAFYQALFELGLTVVYACRVLVSHGCILVWVQNLRRLPG